MKRQKGRMEIFDSSVLFRNSRIDFQIHFFYEREGRNIMVTVTTSAELGQAIKRNESTIVIEGDLANKVVRIKFTGPIAWTIAIGAIGTAVYFYLSTPAATVASTPIGGAGGVVSFGAASGATAVAATALGVNATAVAIGIGIAAGGVGAIIALRDKYKITEQSADRLVLERK